MEQQKILWIIFSVALFILVVVGVGVIWFLPSNSNKVAQTATTQTGNQAKISFDPYEWAKTQNSNYPGLQSAPPSSEPQSQGQNGGNFTIIYGQQPSQPTTSGQQPAVTVSPNSSSTGSATAAAQPAPAPAPQKVASPPQRTVSKPAPAPTHVATSAPPAPKQVRVVQHWIQVAAYTSDFRAEQAKKLLEQKGITGKVMSRDINGKTYFRVRVGPYLSDQEAKKFLSEIKKTTEFRSSYIALVYAYQNAN